MHYFSCSGGPGGVSIKSAPEHITPNLCFFASGGISRSRSAIRCIKRVKRRPTIFMLRWDQYGFDKKRAGTHYAELVFLYPVGSTGHVVQSGATGTQNVDALFFMLAWPRYGFHNKRVGRCYAELMFLHPNGSTGHLVHSGTSRVRTVDALFFVLAWALCGFHKKCVGTRYAKLVFLHPKGSVGHVVHSSASGAQNVNALLSMLGWDRYGFDKSMSVHVMSNLCFCIQVDLQVT
jgi:hypothetical protein